MPIAFGNPRALLLLLLLPLVVWIGRRSLAGLDVTRKRFALGLRLTVVTLLVLGLAEIEWRDLTQKVKVLFLVDRSRSIPEERASLALELVEAARGQMGLTDDLGELVVFGRDAVTEATLAPDRSAPQTLSSVVNRDHTDLEAAVRHALGAVDADVRGRIVLLSDGNHTVGDVDAAVARARAAQVPIDVVPLDYAYEDEVLMEKVVLPREVRKGEPFQARVVVNSVTATPARLKLLVNGAIRQTRQVQLKPGANVETFELTMDQEDFFKVQAIVEPEGERVDRLFQNNTTHGYTLVTGAARVLYVGSEAQPRQGEARYLLEALEAEEIKVQTAVPSEIPLDAAAMQAYDAVLLDNVERDSFSARQERAIEEAVANVGVGLVMIGGDRGFGAGDWHGSPVESALPVEMEIKQEEIIPDGALCMIIHACEFPDGNAIAVKTTKQAVDGLSGQDYVGVLVFGQQGNEWAVPMQKARRKQLIKRKIEKMGVGDMPDFDGIFLMAVQGLDKVDAAVKHMLIMSDGDPSPPRPELLAECRKKRITVSTICYFSHGGAQGPNAQTMRRIANMTGGRYYYIGENDAKKLPQIFVKEAQRVARSLIVNATFPPQQRAASPILAGISDYPALTGYVLTEPKKRADVPLVSPESSPILAHWTYGVGRAVAFTSDSRPRWGANWVEWAGFQKFWAQTVRWVSKDVQDQGLQVKTSIQGDKGVVVVDAVTADGRLLDQLELEAKVTNPEESTEEGSESRVRTIRLVQKGAGRYVGEFPVGGVGTYNVHILRKQGAAARHAATTGLVFPYSAEFRRLRSNRPALEEIARKADGRVIEPEELESGGANPWDRSLLADKVSLEAQWPLALALGLLLFLLDVAVRRVAIDYDKLWARAVAMLPVGKKPGAKGTMDRLRERKQVVREAVEQGASQAPYVPVEPAKERKYVPKGDGDAPLDVAGVTPDGGASGRPKPPQPPTKPAAESGGEEQGSTYSRLLKAKRRAREGMSEDDRG